jgi:hypothetical protein
MPTHPAAAPGAEIARVLQIAQPAELVFSEQRESREAGHTASGAA